MEMKSTAEHTGHKTVLDCVIHSVRNHQVCYPWKKRRRDLGAFGVNNVIFIYVQIN